MSYVSGFVARLLSYAVRCIQIDTRTLAVFRILVGALIIADLVLRSQHFTRLYTDEGMVPQSLAVDQTVDHAFSFYFLTTNPTMIAVLFVIQGLIALQLIVGYHTRIATLFSFLFVVSLDHHNPLVLSYADTLFRLLLFWAVFLPLGERWSIDAIHAGRPPRQHVASIASAAILVQMIYMYVVNGYHKSTNELWTGGEATILIFGLDDTTYLFGDALRAFPPLLQAGGLLWYYSLLLSPLLLVLPGRWRMPLIVLLLGGHAGLALTVRIGAFPYVAIAGVLLFLQSEFWRDAQWAASRLRLSERAASAAAGIERIGVATARWLPSFRLTEGIPRVVTTTVGDFAAIVAVLMVLVIPSIYSLHDEGVIDFDTGRVGEDTRNWTAAIGVRQPPWTVFAPNPRTTDRYHVFAARTADGELLDIYNDRRFTFERPYQQLQRQYLSYRERFYMNSVRRAGFNGQATPILAEYLCNTWRNQRGIEITHIEMYVIAESVTVETIDDPANRATDRSLFYRHGCGDREPMVLDLPEGDD